MTPAEWIPVLLALISAGLLKYVVDILRWWAARRRAKTPEGQQAATMAAVTESLAAVARARDELEDDNTRLRAQLAESEARHAVDRAAWSEERARMRAEIDDLEKRLREILDEVQTLKLRHA